MGCNCRKNKANVITGQGPISAWQVFKNNTYTGRSFTSLISAQNYATRIDGEVRSV